MPPKRRFNLQSSGNDYPAESSKRSRYFDPARETPGATESEIHSPREYFLAPESLPTSTDIDNTHPSVDRPAAAPIRPKCFRILDIPLTWDEHFLRRALIDALSRIPIDAGPCLEDRRTKISLFPSCCGETQTALLNLIECQSRNCSNYFQSIGKHTTKYLVISDETTLLIDCHFYGFTPCNTPGSEPVVE